MTTAAEAADKIMALVDEFPSELFSFDRRKVIAEITDIITIYSQEVEDELDHSFDLGVDTGRNEVMEEMRTQIQELEDEISALRDEKDEAYQKGYDDGFDTAISSAN